MKLFNLCIILHQVKNIYFHADLYKETNGKAGFEGDFHWDYKFEKTFFNYLIDKFK